MSQLLDFIYKKRCCDKEHGIHNHRPARNLLLSSVETWFRSDNTDSCAARDTTEWYFYAVKSAYCIM